MQLDPLSPNLIHLLNNEPVRTAVERFTGGEDIEGSFADILSQAFATTTASDKTDKANSLELMIGETDDLSGMLIDMQKAEIALQLSLQIRNKLIDAYNEVIRMSV